jgi:hypothetical protein
MPEYLAERYEPGIAADTLRSDARRLADTVSAMRDEGAAIEFLGVTFLPTDEGAFTRFSSVSEQLVALAHERASIPFERITEALQLEPAPASRGACHRGTA